MIIDQKRSAARVTTRGCSSALVNGKNGSYKHFSSNSTSATSFIFRVGVLQIGHVQYERMSKKRACSEAYLYVFAVLLGPKFGRVFHILFYFIEWNVKNCFVKLI